MDNHPRPGKEIEVGTVGGWLTVFLLLFFIFMAACAHLG